MQSLIVTKGFNKEDKF